METKDLPHQYGEDSIQTFSSQPVSYVNQSLLVTFTKAFAWGFGGWHNHIVGESVCDDDDDDDDDELFLWYGWPVKGI